MTSEGSAAGSNSTAVLDNYLKRVPQLPPAPTILVELLACFKDSDRDVDRIVNLLSHEQVLTAEVLHCCNSACFAGSEPVSNMFDAISRLGFYEVYCLVTAKVGAQTMAIPQKSGLDAAQLWKHSVFAAQAASVVAKRFEQDEPMAFTAGLLHDTGRLILAAVEPELYSQVLHQAQGQPILTVQAERQLLGVDHAAMGARLFALWHLPPQLCVAVLTHHQLPHNAAILSFAATIQLADVIAMHLDKSAGQTFELNTAAQASLQVLHATPEDLAALIEETQAQIEKIKELFHI